MNAVAGNAAISASVKPRTDLLGWLEACVAGLLFATILFFQSILQPVKLALLVLLLALLVLDISRNRWTVPIHRSILSIALWLPVVGVFHFLQGLVHGNRGAIPSAAVYILWPLLFLLLTMVARTRSSLKGAFSVLFAGTILVSGYGLCFIGVRAGLLPSYFYVDLGLDADVGFYKGFVEVNLKSITTLMAGVPTLIAACLLAPRRHALVTSRPLLWLATGAALVFALLSGRRALWLVIALAPIIIFTLSAFLPRSDIIEIVRRNRRLWTATAVTAAVLGVVGLSIIGIRFEALAEQMMSAFDFSGEAAAGARRDQSIALVSEWREAPLLGQGLGAGARDIVRSVETPWAYELSYLALLMQTGAVGLGLYAMAVAWIFLSGFRVIARGGELAIAMIVALTGLSCFLIANATNPYLQTFDSIWVIFLPVAVLNTALLEARNRKVGPPPRTAE